MAGRPRCRDVGICLFVTWIRFVICNLAARDVPFCGVRGVTFRFVHTYKTLPARRLAPLHTNPPGERSEENGHITSGQIAIQETPAHHERPFFESAEQSFGPEPQPPPGAARDGLGAGRYRGQRRRHATGPHKAVASGASAGRAGARRASLNPPGFRGGIRVSREMRPTSLYTESHM